jgi:hypothetical protein
MRWFDYKHGIMIKLIIFISLSLAYAKDDIPLGTYSSFTETDSVPTVEFELLKDGKAIVTTEHLDSDEGDKPIHKTVQGTWVYKKPLLTITYLKFKDRFRKETNCYQDPCFKYDGSEYKASQEASPLHVSYPFINWMVKKKK